MTQTLVAYVEPLQEDLVDVNRGTEGYLALARHLHLPERGIVTTDALREALELR